MAAATGARVCTRVYYTRGMLFSRDESPMRKKESFQNGVGNGRPFLEQFPNWRFFSKRRMKGKTGFTIAGANAIHQSTNQSIDHTEGSQSINQPINQSITQKAPSQSINQSISRSKRRLPVIQSTNQSITYYWSPFYSYMIFTMGNIPKNTRRCWKKTFPKISRWLVDRFESDGFWSNS